MSETEYVELEVAVCGHTELAVKINCYGHFHWIPKSLIKDEDDFDWSEEASGLDSTMIEIPEWFAEKEGLD